MNIHKQIFVETNFVHTHVCGCVYVGVGVYAHMHACI